MRPIHKAASIGNLDIIKLLIEEYQTAINSLTKLEKTPLWYANSKSFSRLEEYLRSRGGKLNVAELKAEEEMQKLQ